MNRELQIWLVPMVAIILGLVVFYGSKDKNSNIGGYVFLAGFLIFLWLLTFGVPR